ncbi:MAG: hypothetical protein ABSC95_08695 [Acetobacteraceae bacterium]|jgi:hypothetical protein
MKQLAAIVAATALAFAFAAPMSSFAESYGYIGRIVVMPDHSMSVKSMLAAPIYNERHEKIGTVQNIAVPGSAAEPAAILLVGDYPGSGPKMVGVPLRHLELQGKDTMVMAGATKKMLSDLPTYTNAG